MNIFEKAVKTALRFDFQGQISVEQLYNARRTSAYKEALIQYEEELKDAVEAFGKSSRRTAKAKTVNQEQVELRLALVTNLIDEIEAQDAAQAEKAQKESRRQELLALKAAKQVETDRSKTLEEIDAELAAL